MENVQTILQIYIKGFNKQVINNRFSMIYIMS